MKLVTERTDVSFWKFHFSRELWAEDVSEYGRKKNSRTTRPHPSRNEACLSRAISPRCMRYKRANFSRVAFSPSSSFFFSPRSLFFFSSIYISSTTTQRLWRRQWMKQFISMALFSLGARSVPEYLFSRSISSRLYPFLAILATTSSRSTAGLGRWLLMVLCSGRFVSGNPANERQYPPFPLIASPRFLSITVFSLLQFLCYSSIKASVYFA